MAKIAVDVALLLPEAVNKICIGINRKEGSYAYSNLAKKNNHPHITLAMGVIDEKNVGAANSKLQKIAKKFSKLKLEISGAFYEAKPRGKKSYVFKVKPNKDLKRLHATVMKELRPLFSYQVARSMFFMDSNEKFAKTSKIWVENYGKKHSGPKNYHPHISLKCRKSEYARFPIKFTASRMALCHLGNHCTCRTILGSHELG